MGGSSPNSDFFFLILRFFRVSCVVICVVLASPKNKKNWVGVGGCGLANPSFPRIFGFFLT